MESKTVATKSTAENPAKTAASEVPAKMRWTANGEKDSSGNAPSVGVVGEFDYRIEGVGESWRATVKKGAGKPTLVVEGVSGKRAWSACVAHHRVTVEAAKISAA